MYVCMYVCVCVYIVDHIYMGYTVARLVEALRYRPEGRGFDFPWIIGIFFIVSASSRNKYQG